MDFDSDNEIVEIHFKSNGYLLLLIVVFLVISLSIGVFVAWII